MEVGCFIGEEIKAAGVQISCASTPACLLYLTYFFGLGNSMFRCILIFVGLLYLILMQALSIALSSWDQHVRNSMAMAMA